MIEKNSWSVSNIIIAINVLVYILISLILPNFTARNLPQDLGLIYFDFVEFHAYRMLTNLFVHGSIFHLLVNCFSLFSIGNILEKMLGSRLVFYFYFFSGLVSNIMIQLNFASKLYYYQQSFSITPDTLGYFPEIQAVTVGASGAILGLFTILALLYPKLSFFVFPIPVPMKARTLLICFVLYSIYMGYQNFDWDRSSAIGHLGGVLGGIILYLYLKKKEEYLT
ncbi:MAG: rhomboid family intramembrane serine protease [Chitinophagales bacterium]|jgi:membrane associated rhomboid family serine protease|nr:rhomboid family intramembrane serine protease [Chitinophagales bacterium]